MNFEPKNLALAALAEEKCDALRLLLPEGYKPAKDKLSALGAPSRLAGGVFT